MKALNNKLNSESSLSSRRWNIPSWLPKALSVACLVGTDILAIVAALAVVVFVRNDVISRIFPQLEPDSFALDHYLGLRWLLILWLCVFAYEGLYTRRLTFWDELRRLWKAVTIASGSTLAIVALGKLSTEVSRLVLVLHWWTLLLVLPFVRMGIKKLLFKLGLWRKTVVIIGAGQTGVLTLAALNSEPHLGYAVVGFLDDDSKKQGEIVGTCRGQDVRVIGMLKDAPRLLEQGIARDAIIAITSLPPLRLAALVTELQEKAETVRLYPNFFGLPILEAQVDHLLEGQALLLSIPNNLAKPWNLWLKRGFDLLMGGLITLVALPFIGLFTLLIRLDSPGAAFFVHERLGRNGKVFRCFKFRSMYENADEKLTDLLDSNPQLQGEWSTYKKLKSDDPRVTRVGRFLRRWSLDELPQLLNVMRGEMSLVGPRPYLPREHSDMGEYAATVLRTWPGMTGLWQVSGKNELPFERRLYLEMWYVQNWSLWLDFVIFARTLRTVFMRVGAY